jgi:hypothetical protein
MQNEQITPLQHNMRRLVDLSRREGYCPPLFRKLDGVTAFGRFC